MLRVSNSVFLTYRLATWRSLPSPCCHSQSGSSSAQDRVQHSASHRTCIRLGIPARTDTSLRVLMTKRRGQAPPCGYRLDNLRLGAWCSPDSGCVQHHQPQCCWRDGRVQHGDILKGLRALRWAFRSITDIPCHGDVDPFWARSALAKESLVVLHLGGWSSLPPLACG